MSFPEHFEFWKDLSLGPRNRFHISIFRYHRRFVVFCIVAADIVKYRSFMIRFVLISFQL